MKPHQDATYLYTEPITTTGFWIPTEDATLENGCLWFIKGSHKNGLYNRYLAVLYHFNNQIKRTNFYFNFSFWFIFSFVRNPNPNSDMFLMYDKPMPSFDQEQFVACPVKKGSLVIIHGLVVHQSESNRSNKSRYAYTFHVMETDNVTYSSDNWLQLPVGEEFAQLF